jgi:hypothetical protein
LETLAPGDIDGIPSGCEPFNTVSFSFCPTWVGNEAFGWQNRIPDVIKKFHNKNNKYYNY